MKFGDITKRLSGNQRLNEAKTNESLDREKQLMTFDQLDYVAGGGAAGRAGKPGEMEKWYK